MKKIFTLISLLATIFSGVSAQTCDTLFNLPYASDTPTLYIASTGTGAGYLSGNNIYGDLIKAEGFASLPGDSITSALFQFAVCKINSSDSNNIIKFYVWDNTGIDATTGRIGAPGNALDSTTITLRQIAVSVTDSTWLQIYFNGRKTLTDTFYAGVVLPTLTGDTLALWTNSQFGTGGDGWEYAPEYGGWSSYTDLNPSYLNLGNYVETYICGPTPAGIATPAGTNAFTLYPNPAEDIINVSYSGSGLTEKYALFDMLGNQVLVGVITAGNTPLNISALATGTYLLRLGRAQEQPQTFKIMKVK